MTTRILSLLLLLTVAAQAQLILPPKTTTFTRDLLTSASATEARSKLGVGEGSVQTNSVINNITNQYLVTEVIQVTSNAYFNQTIVTNLTVTENINVAKGATLNQVYYLLSAAKEVGWAGPTNSCNFALGSLQAWTATTDVSITNIANATNGFGNTALICFTNAATTNITLRLGTGIKVGPSDPMVCTNGDILECWIFASSNRVTAATKIFH